MDDDHCNAWLLGEVRCDLLPFHFATGEVEHQATTADGRTIRWRVTGWPTAAEMAAATHAE